MKKKESSYNKRKKEVVFWKKKAEELSFDIRSLERILADSKQYEDKFVAICEALADRNLSECELYAILSSKSEIMFDAIGLIESIQQGSNKVRRFFEEVVDMDEGSVFGSQKKTTND